MGNDVVKAGGAPGAVALDYFSSAEALATSIKIAAGIAQADILPATFKGKPANVLIALDLAMRLELPPMMVMQGIVIVNGRPTFTGQFYTCLAKKQYKEFRYEETETDETVKEIGGLKNHRCRIVAETHGGEKIVGPWVDYKMAVKDGWATRPGSKWQTMPDLMLRYRAASFFVRTYCPDAVMGFRDEYEQADIPVEKPVQVKAEQPDFVRAIRDRPRAIVETEVFKDAEVIEPEDEGVNYSDAAEVMRQTIEDAPAKKPFTADVKAKMLDAIGAAESLDRTYQIEERFGAYDIPDADLTELRAAVKKQIELFNAFGA